MKKIDKLFVKSYIGPFALTTTIVVFIFLMRFLMIYFDQFIGKNLEFSVFVRLFFYFSLITIPTSLPLATLLATLMTFGNMGEHSELTAMKSAGIPLTRLAVPTFILSILVAIFSLFYNNYVNPWANLKGWSLLYDVKTAKLALNIQEGIFYNEIPGYRIKVEKKSPDGTSMKNIMVYDHNGGSGNKNVTLADSGSMYTINHESQLVFELFNGVNYTEGNTYNTSQQMTKYAFKTNKMVFSLTSFGMTRTNEDEFLYHEYMKSIPELNETIDSLNQIITDRVDQQATALKNMDTYTVERAVVQNAVVVDIKDGRWIDSLIAESESKMRESDYYNIAKTKIMSQKAQLESDMVQLTSYEKPVWGADLERWNKFSTAFSCLAMFLIGASLGSIIKRGGFGLPVLVSIAFFILYYLMQQMGGKYTKEGLIPAVVGAWFPFIVLFIIGLVLMNRAKNI